MQVLKIFRISIIFILLITNAYSMPPHDPNYKRDGSTRKKNYKNKFLEKSKQTTINSNKTQKSYSPSGNDVKILIILMSYYDLSMDANSTPAFYENLFNTEGSGVISFRQYFKDMSNNTFNVSCDIVGPYTSIEVDEYYGVNDFEQNNDRYFGELAGEAIDEAEKAGINFSQYDNNNDGEVDGVIVIHAGIGEEYDPDLYADSIWSQCNDLDYRLSLNDGTGHRFYDNKIINDFMVCPEFYSTSSPSDSSIGVFCHEFGHLLGLMDLYDVSGYTNGVGLWSLMASGAWCGPENKGEQPAPLLAWEKERLGWLTPEVLTSTGGLHNILEAESTLTTYPKAYRIQIVDKTNEYSNIEDKKNTSYASLIISGIIIAGLFITSLFRRKNISGIMFLILISLISIPALTMMTGCPVVKTILVFHNNQYYLLENKQTTSVPWTQYLPGSGLLITHIDEYVIKIAFRYNMINSYIYVLPGFESVHGVDIIEADSLEDYNDGFDLWSRFNLGEETDLFYQGNKTELSTTSTPKAPINIYPSPYVAVKGTANVNITDISSPGPTMNFVY